ncbi:hypothetical protein [Aeromonas media]|uniref:hypothetical protein n=1 Tax=Aeromonas media TaxID=651 RepID=UPI0011166F0A|nr:hypothetical protein [Aeromonas media]
MANLLAPAPVLALAPMARIAPSISSSKHQQGMKNDDETLAINVNAVINHIFKQADLLIPLPMIT